jgi:hypothetical protein
MPPVSPFRPISPVTPFPATHPQKCTSNSFACHTPKSKGLEVALLTSSVQFVFRELDRRPPAVFSAGAGGAIPEIALLPFAGVALQVASAVLPTYRPRFSKHQFTQPQLLAILCLMRYEDWTFREAEVRLREHSELRAALRLSSVPDYTTV